jgi:hypothetical protein
MSNKTNTVYIDGSLSIQGYNPVVKENSVEFGCKNVSISQLREIEKFIKEGEVKEVRTLVNKKSGKKVLSEVIETTTKFLITRNGRALPIDEYEYRMLKANIPYRIKVEGNRIHYKVPEYSQRSTDKDTLLNIVETLLAIHKFLYN